MSRSYPALILLLMVIILAAPGCKLNQAQVGPNPARITVILEGRAKLDPKPDYGQWKDEVAWTYDLYLITEDGSWKELPTEPPREAISYKGNPLQHQTVFLAPPGKLKLKLLVHGFFRAYVGRLALTDSLVSLEKDYGFDLAPGQAQSIKVRAGGK